MAASSSPNSSPARAVASARCEPSCQPITMPFQMICDTSSMNGSPRPRSAAAAPRRVRRKMYGCSAATWREGNSCTIGSGRGQPYAMPSCSAMRIVSRSTYGGQSGLTCSKNPGIRTAIGSTTRTRTARSYSRSSCTRRRVARYEYGLRNDQKRSTLSMSVASCPCMAQPAAPVNSRWRWSNTLGLDRVRSTQPPLDLSHATLHRFPCSRSYGCADLDHNGGWPSGRTDRHAQPLGDRRVRHRDPGRHVDEDADRHTHGNADAHLHGIPDLDANGAQYADHYAVPDAAGHPYRDGIAERHADGDRDANREPVPDAA